MCWHWLYISSAYILPLVSLSQCFYLILLIINNKILLLEAAYVLLCLVDLSSQYLNCHLDLSTVRQKLLIW